MPAPFNETQLDDALDRAATALELIRLATKEMERAVSREFRRELARVVAQESEKLSQLLGIFADALKLDVQHAENTALDNH